MATDCERSFSLAKLTLETQRLSMTTETLEKLQCLKNWVRHGAVKRGATIGGGGTRSNGRLEMLAWEHRQSDLKYLKCLNKYFQKKQSSLESYQISQI
ncbi:transposase-like protein [Fusarium oxysporum f. sp. phaseoli]